MITRCLRSALLAALVASPAVAGAPTESWDSPFQHQHPLTGRIYATETQRFIEPAELVARLDGARFVLLGETHANPDHHRLQAWVVRRLGRSGESLAVVWEMAGPEHADALSRFAGQPSALGSALDWRERGWPAWDHYQPIAEAAAAIDAPMRPGAPAQETERTVLHGGLAALGADKRRRLALDRPLPEPDAAARRRTLQRAHCRALPERAVTAMAAVQRLRDAVMARALRTAARDHGRAVLIAGRGHTRGDRGVPRYLTRMSDSTPVTVAFRAVRPGVDAARAYAAASPDGAVAHDYLWFTPRGLTTRRVCPP